MRYNELKKLKPGTYYTVDCNGEIGKINFVKYYEKTFKDVYVGYGEYEDETKYYLERKLINSSRIETTYYRGQDIFTTLDEAKTFIKENYHKHNIKKLYKEISKEKKAMDKLDKLTDDKLYFY